MIRRLRVVWPDARPFAGRAGRSIRLLAVSDDVDPALDHEVNRAALGRLDAIVGCGDLEPDYLCFLADAFGLPLIYVRGNHDRGGHWSESARGAPVPLRTGSLVRLEGLCLATLEWPGLRRGGAPRDERGAWHDAVRLAGALLVRRLRGRLEPVLVLSHAPPSGVGDRAADPYHRGFRAYRWLLERLHPPLWLHGHVPPASVEDWRAAIDGSLVANVTGAVVVELVAPGSERRPGDGRPVRGGQREAA